MAVYPAKLSKRRFANGILYSFVFVYLIETWKSKVDPKIASSVCVPFLFYTIESPDSLIRFDDMFKFI
jgi:hypothetical protein